MIRIIFLLILTIFGSKGDKISDLFSTETTEFERESLTVQGQPLPSWLRGTWIQNGLGVFELGGYKFTHSFDAYAKIHSWTFPGNGSVFFSSKQLQTESYTSSVEANVIQAYLLFGKTDPEWWYATKIAALAKGIDNPNVMVVRYGTCENPEFHALSDFIKSYQVNPMTMDTLGSSRPVVPGPSYTSFGVDEPSSAHALPEYGTTNMINFVVISDEIRVIRIKSNDNRELIATISVDRMPYMHSFGLTPHYAIFFLHPVYIDVSTIVVGGSPFDSLTWEGESQNMTIKVVNLKNGSITTFTAPPVFVLHQVNAYELSCHVRLIVDVVTYKNLQVYKNFAMNNLKNPSQRTTDHVAIVKSYSLSLDPNNPERIVVSPHGTHSQITTAGNMDFPAINEKYRGLGYCYAYGVVNLDGNFGRNCLWKLGLCSRTHDKRWYQVNHTVSEPVFIPYPNATEYQEDKGLLMSMVYDSTRQKSYVLILDAETMTKKSEIDLSVRLPFTLHGQFFPNLVQ